MIYEGLVTIDGRITFDPFIKIFAHSKNVFAVSFKFQKTWEEDLNIKAVFKLNDNDTVSVDLENNITYIPEEVLTGVGNLKIGLIGTKIIGEEEVTIKNTPFSIIPVIRGTYNDEDYL